MNKRRCNKCGGTYDAIFFESGGSNKVGMHTYLAKSRSICKGCSQSARDKSKLANRWRSKMRSTRKMHAQKFSKSLDDFENFYKWNLEQMEHDARHAYENGCPLCGETFFLMGHGLADITLDIIVRDSPPVYGTNTRWLCATCNRQKGKYTMREHGTLMVNWQLWKHQTDNIWIGSLFEFLAPEDLENIAAVETKHRAALKGDTWR